jgi:hypothetical protein
MSQCALQSVEDFFGLHIAHIAQALLLLLLYFYISIAILLLFLLLLFSDWPVNGNWAEWGEWSKCAKSCGGSVVTRKRTCTNPAPLRNGLPCEGNATETAMDCIKHCPSMMS